MSSSARVRRSADVLIRKGPRTSVRLLTLTLMASAVTLTAPAPAHACGGFFRERRAVTDGPSTHRITVPLSPGRRFRAGSAGSVAVVCRAVVYSKGIHK